MRKLCLRGSVGALLLVIPMAWARSQPGPDDSVMTAEQIMLRVAAHQDTSEAERAHYVYLQHARVQSRKGSTLMCEEITDTRVTPAPKGNTRTQLSLAGQVRSGDRMVHYSTTPVHWQKENGQESRIEDGDTSSDKEVVLDADANNKAVTVSDTDLDLVESMRRQFTSDQKSKDGISNGLFPLTSEQQRGMSFTLKGKEQKNGRETYHIIFRPRDKTDYGWKGDAWIDVAAFEPVVVRTALSRSLPLGVRMLLGTNLPGLGFTAIYAPQSESVWFPASFGTEFKVRLFFFFHRQIVVAVENRNFERTHVSSTVHVDASQPVPEGKHP